MVTLQELFSPRDVELIQSIPLSSKPAEDKFFWPFTPTGICIVKSGYRFLYKSRSLDNNEYQPEDNTLWKRIWGSQVQPKVQNFLWRAIKNSIPTEVNLKRRMILTDDRYNHCKGATEDVLHALWSCPWPLLSKVWSHDNAWNYSASLHFLSFRELVEHIMETWKDIHLFAMLVWAIYQRKSVRTSAKPFPIQQVHLEAQNARASFV